jgi:hypothetical protein
MKSLHLVNRFLAFAAALMAIQPLAKCVEFSAEMAYVGDGQIDWGKAYVGEQKLRLEFQQGWTIRIADLQKNIEYESIGHAPANESSLGRRAFELAVGGPLREPASPCAQIVSWFVPDNESPVKQNNLSCKRGPAVLVNGRRTEQWDLTLSAGGNLLKLTAWIDPELKHCIRIQVTTGGETIVPVELRNIKVERQPAALFEIPIAGKTTR